MSMEFFVPFKNVSYKTGSQQENRDISALRGVTVEAKTEDAAVAIVSRILGRWNVDFKKVPA